MHLKYAFQHQSMRDLAERRMRTVCDTVEAGEEIMYRISTGKLLQELLRKARRMVTKGLPSSLEERFVRRAPQKWMVKDTKLRDGGNKAEKNTEDTPTSNTEEADKNTPASTG